MLVHVDLGNSREFDGNISLNGFLDNFDCITIKEKSGEICEVSKHNVKVISTETIEESKKIFNIYNYLKDKQIIFVKNYCFDYFLCGEESDVNKYEELDLNPFARHMISNLLKELLTEDLMFFIIENDADFIIKYKNKHKLFLKCQFSFEDMLAILRCEPLLKYVGGLI